jgi:NAD(P)-dependent dehydrogenase (short-subunit alcohol dehydrogenase family)
VAQAGLGFYAAGPLARESDPVILLLGGLGLLRAVADLVTALRLREVSGVRHEVLHLSPEREAGVAGYSAGLTDFEGTPQAARAKHRAGAAFHDEVVRTTKDLDTMIAQAGVTGSGVPAHQLPEVLPPVPDTPEGAEEAAVGEEKLR